MENYCKIGGERHFAGFKFGGERHKRYLCLSIRTLYFLFFDCHFCSFCLVMKKLGLIGGFGPQSTVPYYMNIVYGVRERTSPDFFPNLTIESLNVFHVLRLIEENRLDELTEYLLNGLRALKAAGAEVGALTANTAHIVFDRLAELSPIPLISIIDATCAEAKRRGFSRLALLGTRFTMEGEFFKAPFVREGIGIVVPNDSERDYIQHTIVSELELGIVKPETLARYQDIISRLRDEDAADAVILGCTELPLLLNDSNSPLPVLDTVRIHTSALITAALT